MSIWGEMLNRSTGDAMRKEDKIIADPLTQQPLVFAGNIDEGTIPSAPKGGQIFYTNDVVTINGIEYPSGCMVLYDGTNWINVGDFVHQRVDTNIGYWQPVDVQESSII